MNIAYFLLPKARVAYLYDDYTFRQGLEKMRHHGYTAIPVISRAGQYIGTVSEGDFLWRLLSEDGVRRCTMKDLEQLQVREILRVSQEPVSLETPIGEEEDSHLGDFIPDDDAPSPVDAASHTLLREQLNNVLKTLAPREAKVLSLRFGLEDGKSRTLEEVGKEFNVTRERIRQIEAKALRKLRHPSRSKKLKDFLD